MVGNQLNAMGHLIPEHKMDRLILHSVAAHRVNHMDVVNEMFSSEGNKAEGISAVKAIAIASAEGQKIWTITQENVEDALASINLDADTESEIRNSVNAGMVVTTHEQSINFNGWIGEGYIILDPATGAGAYKIAGGGNGGFLSFISTSLSVLGYLKEFSKGWSKYLGPKLSRAGAYVTMLSVIFDCPHAAAGLVALIMFLAIAMIILVGILTAAMPFFAGFFGRLIMNYVTSLISNAILSAAKQSRGC